MLNVFVEAGEAITKYEQLLADINSMQEFTDDPFYEELEFPDGVEQSIDSVAALIKNNDKIVKSIPLLLFSVYILKEDINEMFLYLFS